MPMPKIDDEELSLLLSHTGPKNLESFKNQARLLKLKRQYEKLISKDPVVAYTYLGIIEAYNNRNKEALTFLHKALALSPNEVVILQNIAKTYEQEGKFDLAVEYFFKSLKAAPNDMSIFNNIFHLGEFFFDIQVLNKLEQINPVLYRQIPESSALQLIQFLSERDFDFANYKYQLSCCYKAINKILNLHENAIQRYFNFEGNYLDNFIEIDSQDIDLINKIQNSYEDELYLFASQQEDGGFDFYDKLNQSCISFTFLCNDKLDISRAV